MLMLPPPDAVPFPIFLDLAGARVIVVGGGEAAFAKIRLLQRSRAILTVVDPMPLAEIAVLAEDGRLELRRRCFVTNDLDGARLCYVALDDVAEAAEVVAEARRRGVLVNAVDRPALCDFTTPAIVERGSIVIAISTGGAAPALARALRARVEAAVPPAYSALAAFCRRWRGRVRQELGDRERRRHFWDAVVAGSEAAAVLDGNSVEAEALIADRLGRAQSGDTAPSGRASFIDVGTGDPEQLTLKALRAVQGADVILYDTRIGTRILDFARRDARRIDVGKWRGRQAMGEAAIDRLIHTHARAGAHIVRLMSNSNGTVVTRIHRWSFG
jgi:uroporphyrin-III C-methyltransferase/precorrin-2 dehydrogenase/sirohydrochlorin ferrochelatase